MLLPGLYAELSAATSVTSLLGAPTTPTAPVNIFISVAVKQASRPFLVMNLVAAPPAEASLDGISALIDGEIQFDSYADTPQQARQLSLAVRDFLMTSFNSGALPDGTNIQFVDVTMDHDEPYEQGGVGYLYRALLRLKAFYTEAEGIGPPSGGATLTRYGFTPAPNGVITAFTAPVNISPNALVVRNGMILTATVDYNYGGAVVAFVIAPATGDILALYQ